MKINKLKRKLGDQEDSDGQAGVVNKYTCNIVYKEVLRSQYQLFMAVEHRYLYKGFVVCW